MCADSQASAERKNRAYGEFVDWSNLAEIDKDVPGFIDSKTVADISASLKRLE
jgi:hypothetical protein